MVRSGRNTAGQGALEYLLLIGGAVLVAVIVLVLIFGGIFPGVGNITSENINNFTTTVSLNAAFGGGGGPGPGPNCPDGDIDAGEQCDGTDLAGQTCASLGYGGGTLSCTATCTFTGCTGAPQPPVATFSMSTGTNPSEITSGFNVTNYYEAGFTYETIFDDVDPSSITNVAQFDAYCGSTSCLFTGAPIPYPNAPSLDSATIVFPAAGTLYYGIMKVCNSSVTACAITNIANATSQVVAAPPTYNTLVASLASSSAGVATYDFTWSGSALPAGLSDPISGVFISPYDLIGSFGLSFTTDETTTGAGAFLTHNPVQPPKPVFTITNGSGGQTGTITGAKLKEFASQPGAAFTPYFYMVAQDIPGSSPGATKLDFIDDAVGVYPTDTTGPASPTNTAASNAGLPNGANLMLTWDHPLDTYIGASLSGLSYAVDYILAYSTTPILTSGDIDTLVSSGKSVNGSFTAGTTGVSKTMNYNDGLIPSQTYNLALRVCDKVDGKTVLSSPNCTDLVSAGSGQATKETFSSEAELGSFTASVAQSNVTVGTETQTILSTNPTTCSSPTAAAVTVTFPSQVLKSPSSTPTAYYIWARGANTTAAAGNNRYVKVGSSINAATTLIAFPSAASSYAWRSTGTPVMWNGGTQDITFMFADLSGNPFCQNNLRIDEIYITTNPSCTPTTKNPTC